MSCGIACTSFSPSFEFEFKCALSVELANTSLEAASPGAENMVFVGIATVPENREWGLDREPVGFGGRTLPDVIAVMVVLGAIPLGAWLCV
jgi:hypothetical protein